MTTDRALPPLEALVLERAKRVERRRLRRLFRVCARCVIVGCALLYAAITKQDNRTLAAQVRSAHGLAVRAVEQSQHFSEQYDAIAAALFELLPMASDVISERDALYALTRHLLATHAHVDEHTDPRADTQTPQQRQPSP